MKSGNSYCVHRTHGLLTWKGQVQAGRILVEGEFTTTTEQCDVLHRSRTHDQSREGASAALYGGHPMVLSGLKTLLETGELLTTPGSLQYT